MTPTEHRIIKALDQIAYALGVVEDIVNVTLDHRDARTEYLRYFVNNVSRLTSDLVQELPLSPPSPSDKEATAPAVDTKQATPEFASHSVGDRVEFSVGVVLGIPLMEQGMIRAIDSHGMAEISGDNGRLYFHDLCALENLSRKDGV